MLIIDTFYISVYEGGLTFLISGYSYCAGKCASGSGNTTAHTSTFIYIIKKFSTVLTSATRG